MALLFKLLNLSDQGRLVYSTAFVVPLDAKKETCCSDGLGLNYTLPMFNECKKKPHPNGSEVQTIPKLIPYSPADGACPKPALKNKLGIPPGHRVCRFPDCESNPCQNGWCEETMLGYDCHCPTGFEGKNCDEKSSGTTVDTNTISTSEPESPSTPTLTESTAATDSTTVTPSDSTLQSTFPTSTSGPPTTTASTAPTDATTITPSDSTLQATSPTSTSSPTMTAASSASTDATTVTPSDSTLPVTSSTSTSAPLTTTATSPTSTSGPPTTTGSITPTDATTITPSDSTLPVTSPTSTSGPPTTTASSARTDATTVTPSDSSLPVTSSTSTARPPTATAKIFVTDSDANAIFVSEIGDTLNFPSIPSTSSPLDIKYDPTERHIYWSDWDDYCVYRANLDGEDREQVTAMGANDRDSPSGIATAERSRVLYIAYYYADKVTSMSIERGSPLPGTETDLVNQDISYPRALVIDEEEGFLYISRSQGIVRALLNATNVIEKVYRNTNLRHLSGLSIDLTRHPRRIFFSDWIEKRTFYKELSTDPSSYTSTAVELTEYTQNPRQETLRDVKYFNSTLYWVKANDPKGIGIMKDFDQTNRSYRVQEISQFESPRRMLIIT